MKSFSQNFFWNWFQEIFREIDFTKIYELLEELNSIRSGTLDKLPAPLVLTKAPPANAPGTDPDDDDEFPVPPDIAPANAALLLFPVVWPGSVLGLAASLFCDDGDSCFGFGPPPDPPPPFLL